MRLRYRPRSCDPWEEASASSEAAYQKTVLPGVHLPDDADVCAFSMREVWEALQPEAVADLSSGEAKDSTRSFFVEAMAKARPHLRLLCCISHSPGRRAR